MKISILIAVKEWNGRLKECLDGCRNLTYPDFEVIVLPDETLVFEDPHVRIIPTGPCLPADKRDIGGKMAIGEILAFLDDDAIPDPGWLEPAAALFQGDPMVAAVGGPAVTPPQEPSGCKASGHVYESFVMSGSYRYRYLPAPQRLIDDYPSCNLLVRKNVFFKLGGFRTYFWPGEDTILCLGIVEELGLKIVYDPRVRVLHHRRSLFKPHLKQIASYAAHRGYFVKRYPQTSLRLPYFIPSLFVAFLVFGPFLLPFQLFCTLAAVYSAAVFFGSLHAKRPGLIGLTFIGVILSHITYGIYFLHGLVASRLAEERPALS